MGRKFRKKAALFLASASGLVALALPAAAEGTTEQAATATPWGRLLSLGILLLLCIVMVLIGKFNRPKK